MNVDNCRILPLQETYKPGVRVTLQFTYHLFTDKIHLFWKGTSINLYKIMESNLFSNHQK